LESAIAHTANVEFVISCPRRVGGKPGVPIRELLDGSIFGPEDIANLTAAFEAALPKLGLIDRKDPITLTVARLIIGLAKQGERDPQKLCDRAVKMLRK
jgi:hypothetical protein